MLKDIVNSFHITTIIIRINHGFQAAMTEQQLMFVCITFINSNVLLLSNVRYRYVSDYKI